MSKRVLVTKNMVDKRVKTRLKIFDFPVPEFSNDGDIEYFRVRLASLDDQIKARHLASAPISAMIKMYQRIVDGTNLSKEELVKDIIISGLHPKTVLTMSIFIRCVIEPVFTPEEVIELSKTYPDLVNRVVLFALGSNTSEAKDG